MAAKPLSADELRAARLSRLPGVTLAEAAARFGVAPARVRAARKQVSALSLAELALAALTDNGQKSTFSTRELGQVASYIDYVNHDACSADDVRALLDELVKSGAIALDGHEARLLTAWP